MNGETRVRDLRLVPLAAMVWCVALTCVFFPAVAWWCAGIAFALGLGMLWLMRRRRDDARPVSQHPVPRHPVSHRPGGGVLAVVALAMAAAAMTAAFAVPQREAAAELSGRVIEVVGEITSSSSKGSDGRLWFDLQSTHAGTLGAPEALAVPLRVGVDPESGLDLGAVIRVTGDAMVTDPGERAAIVVFGMRVQILQPAQGVFGIAAQVREDFVTRATSLPEPGAGLLPGLAVGDTRAVSEELNDAMLTSGLSHLTAVSGAKEVALLSPYGETDLTGLFQVRGEFIPTLKFDFAPTFKLSRLA